MNEKQRAAWEKTRKQGFDWYVVKCTLGIGILLPAIQLLASFLFDDHVRTDRILKDILLGVLIGFFTSWSTFELNERAYKKATANKR
jgi:hypothetical protein